MSADRTEKRTVNRTHTGTHVKVTITANGVTVAYSVKTYETQVGEAARRARAGAEKLLAEVTK